MSLRIDINTIARLLLEDGLWYDVLPGSLTIDSFEWTDAEGLGVGRGHVADVPETGLRSRHVG